MLPDSASPMCWAIKTPCSAFLGMRSASSCQAHQQSRCVGGLAGLALGNHPGPGFLCLSSHPVFRMMLEIEKHTLK